MTATRPDRVEAGHPLPAGAGVLARWWRVAAVIGVLGGAAALGFATVKVADRLDPWLAVVAAAAPLAVFGLNELIKRWNWMPILILIAAAFIPVSLPTGTESRLVDSLLLTLGFAGLWILRMITVERRLSLIPSPLNAPILIFMAVNLVAVGWSVVFRDPLVYASNSFMIVQIASAVVNMALPGVLLMMNNFVHDVRTLKALVGVMLFAGGVGLLKRFDLVSGLPINVEGLFTMWVITLSLGLALFVPRLPQWARALLFTLAGLYLFWGLILHVSWLAGWLPGILAVGVILFMRSKRTWILAVLGVIVVIALNMDFVNSTLGNENTESGGTRMAAWAQNWKITKDHLLFGTGPAGYAAYYMSYFPTNAMATHSNYVDMLAQVGIIGVIPFLIYFVGLAVIGYRLCLRVRGRGDFVEALANVGFAGTVSCLITMAFGDWLFPFAYTQTIAGFDYVVYSWLFMGTILVLDRLTAAEPATGTRAICSSAA